jgi:hypothetical protein
MFNYKEKYYFLFSKSGYSDECKKNTGNNTALIEFKNMTQTVKS